MKLIALITVYILRMSLPPRGAWIEIHKHLATQNAHESRSPRGERGLKLHRLHRHGSSFPVAPPAGSVD